VREGERQRGREGGRKVEASGPARSLQPAAVRASRFTEPHRTYVCKRLFSQYPESAASARAQPSASTCTLPAHTNCADRPRIPAQAALQANIFYALQPQCRRRLPGASCPPDRALRWECWLEGLPPRVFTISQPCCGPAPSSPRALAAVLGATSADGAKSRRCKPCASGLRSFLAPPLDLLSRTGLVEDLGCHLTPLALVCRLLYAPPTRRAPPLVLG